jgi:hypothetical protein
LVCVSDAKADKVGDAGTDKVGDGRSGSDKLGDAGIGDRSGVAPKESLRLRIPDWAKLGDSSRTPEGMNEFEDEISAECAN